MSDSRNLDQAYSVIDSLIKSRRFDDAQNAITEVLDYAYSIENKLAIAKCIEFYAIIEAELGTDNDYTRKLAEAALKKAPDASDAAQFVLVNLDMGDLNLARDKATLFNKKEQVNKEDPDKRGTKRKAEAETDIKPEPKKPKIEKK